MGEIIGIVVFCVLVIGAAALAGWYGAAAIRGLFL